MPRSISRAAAAVVATIIFGANPVSAHHAGGVGNALGAGPIITISASTLDKDHSVAAVTLDYQSLDGLSTETLLNATANMPPGSPESNNVHDLRTIQAYAISYAYGVTNDFTVALRLPYVRRTGIREAVEDEATGDLEVENFGAADGIGDLTLFGQYRFFNQNHTELAALFGLKTPTGRTNDLTAQGELFDAEFQPGSGSWDPLLGLAWTHHEGKWSYDANVLYTLATTGTQNTDLGDRFQYNFAVSYRLTSLGSGEHPMFHGAEAHEEGDDGHHHEQGHESTGPSLDLVLELNGEWHAEQVTNGISDPNSGGNTVFISPGLRLSQDKWSGFVSMGIPIVDDLNGIQSEPDWRVIAGATWLFEPGP
jgi:hypothetical protein